MGGQGREEGWVLAIENRFVKLARFENEHQTNGEAKNDSIRMCLI